MTATQLRTLQVFIVEDESMLALLLEDMIVGLGYQVAGLASRLAEAMSKTAELDFDIAVLDVNLDGEVSYPVAQQLQQRGIPFIFATGYGRVGVPQQFDGVPVLDKPFRQQDLQGAFDEALALGDPP